MAIDRGQQDRHGDDGSVTIERRITTLEVNQTSLAETLKATVEELKKITLSIAERRGAEKLSLLIGGGFLTGAGWLIEHLANLAVK